MAGNYRGLFEGWEIAVAKELIGRFRPRWRSLEREGLEDLLQECLFHWYGVRDQFDPGREASRRTFMTRVVRNKLADLAREWGADKRGGETDIVSLEEKVTDSDDARSFGELLDALLAREAEGLVDARDARIDLSKALSGLTAAQRRLCELLAGEGLSVMEAAKRLRIPRTTLYEEIKRIRKVFADHGLGEYVKR